MAKDLKTEYLIPKQFDHLSVFFNTNEVEERLKTVVEYEINYCQFWGNYDCCQGDGFYRQRVNIPPHGMQ